MSPAVRPPWGLGEFLQLSLRLLEPERHAHLAVHRRRGGEVLACLFALARAREQLPEAEVAVGDEWAHAALEGQGQGVAIETLRVRAIARRCDVAGQTEGIGFASASPEPA